MATKTDVPRSLCVDCGLDTTPSTGAWEWYIVHDHLWSAAGMGYDDGALCIGCLESRLRRRLEAADFPDIPVNSLDDRYDRKAFWWRTDRLLHRLTSP